MEIILQNEKIKKAGIITLEHIKFGPIPNFIDYLQSGLQLNMVTAIDFTGFKLIYIGSNGAPNNSKSLHYIKNPPTQYQLVLKAIWEIVSNYDCDKRIPAFGFGAKPHFPNINSDTVNHCFPLNDNAANP